MKKKKECNIIQNLLPNYIDHLTNEELNEYVKQHLDSCEECMNIYHQMAKEITKEEKQKDLKAIEGFKKVKRNIRVAWMIIVLLILIIFANCAYLYYLNQQKPEYFRVTEASWKNTNLLIEYKNYNYNKKDGSYIEAMYICTFNKNGKCIDTRVLIENLDPKTKQEMLQGYTTSKSAITNLQETETTIVMNINLYNNETKEEIVSRFKDSTNEVRIKEL